MVASLTFHCITHFTLGMMLLVASGTVALPADAQQTSADRPLGILASDRELWSSTPTIGSQGVSAGSNHTCALTNTGGLMCWGDNMTGQLGDGTTNDSVIPVGVVGLDSNVSAVTGGAYHTCALTGAGGVKCWGNNDKGQLGDSSTTDSATPVDVVELAQGMVAITAGGAHTCALTDAGGVKCWGDNWAGQLGSGTTTRSSVPVDVVGLAGNAIAIESGEWHTCVLIDTGNVKCWGNNYSGQLGDGTTTSSSTPVDVIGLASLVKSIAAGGLHNCAVLHTGDVKCWGYSWANRSSNGMMGNALIPVNMVGLADGIVAITVGDDHTCGLTNRGGVRCWGSNYDGQLGDGTRTYGSATPVNVIGLAGGVSAISAGGRHNCAQMMTGAIRCWGHNYSGQLGNGTTNRSSMPMDTFGLESDVAAISAGYGHSCELTNAGAVKCWGDNMYRQLGSDTPVMRYVPQEVSAASSGVSAISTGSWHTCDLTDAGGVRCWGQNNNGQLGDGTTNGSSAPVDATGLVTGVRVIAAGAIHTCALTNSGGVKCWGHNGQGRLGDGTTTKRLTPVDVYGLTSGVSAISAGTWHTCALMNTGGVKCWGWNGNGQLGDGSQSEQHTPVDVSGLASGVCAITAGHSHTCALMNTGAIKCWGENEYGQLGDGTTAERYVPTDVSGLTNEMAAISAGGEHTCAISVASEVQCWGNNSAGQLGNGTTTIAYTPVNVVGLSGSVSDIAAGYSHTCALIDSSTVKCWGENMSGQLGVNPGWSPVDVSGLGAYANAYLPLIIQSSQSAP